MFFLGLRSFCGRAGVHEVSLSYLALLSCVGGGSPNTSLLHLFSGEEGGSSEREGGGMKGGFASHSDIQRPRPGYLAVSSF